MADYRSISTLLRASLELSEQGTVTMDIKCIRVVGVTFCPEDEFALYDIFKGLEYIFGNGNVEEGSVLSTLAFGNSPIRVRHQYFVDLLALRHGNESIKKRLGFHFALPLTDIPSKSVHCFIGSGQIKELISILDLDISTITLDDENMLDTFEVEAALGEFMKRLYPDKASSSFLWYAETATDLEWQRDNDCERVCNTLTKFEALGWLRSLEWYLPFSYYESIVIPRVLGIPLERRISIIHSRPLNNSDPSKLTFPDTVDQLVELLKASAWPNYRLRCIEKSEFGRYTFAQYLGKKINARSKLKKLLKPNAVMLSENFLGDLTDWGDLYHRSKLELNEIRAVVQQSHFLNCEKTTFHRDVNVEELEGKFSMRRDLQRQIEESIARLESSLYLTEAKQSMISNHVRDLFNTSVQRSISRLNITLVVLTILLLVTAIISILILTAL